MDFGAILKALFFIVIGLLLIDFAPIHEGMTCEEPNNATTCPDVYFSQSFWAARTKFINSAKAVGAKLERHVVHTSNETGIEYPMDVAFIEGAGAAKDNLVIHVSGVHGAEGFVGSAIQTKVLQTPAFWKAATRPSVLFVHAVNPYGFAENRRFNENNVDLNRNCLTPEGWKQVLERDPNIAGYEDFREFLAPTGAPTLFGRYALLVRVLFASLKYGYTKGKMALVSGQYHDSQGPFFGGQELQPSLVILQKVLEPYKKFKQIYVLDIHTGLGKAGHDTLLAASEEGAAAMAEALPAMVSSIEVIGKGAVTDGYRAAGTLDYNHLLGGRTDVVMMFQEFGTLPGMLVGSAVVLENQAYQYARGTFIHQVTGQWLRNAFYPQELATKKMYLERGATVFNATMSFV